MNYSFNSRVRYSETGENGKLTLPGVLNYFQDCCTFESEQTGVGMEVLKEQCAVGIDEIISIVNQFEQPVTFLGDGVPVFQEYIAENCSVPYTFAPAHVNKQRAGAVAALGMKYFAEGRSETAAEHKPEYLRLSQAERERKEGGLA